MQVIIPKIPYASNFFIIWSFPLPNTFSINIEEGTAHTNKIGAMYIMKNGNHPNAKKLRIVKMHNIAVNTIEVINQTISIRTILSLLFIDLEVFSSYEFILLLF
jgi:hypothetical protein